MSSAQIGDGSKNVAVGSAIAITGEDGDDISAAEVEKAVKEAENEPSPANEGQKEESPNPEEKTEAKQEKAEEKKEEAPAPKKSEDSSSKAPAKSESSFSAAPEKRDHIFASPIAKRMALDRGIALAQVKGTGPNGRIIKVDIENYKPAPAASASSSSASASKGSSAPPAGTKLPPGSPPAKDMTVPAAYEDIPASNMRKVIASRLTESKQSTPHYYLTAEIKMDRVLKLREVFNKAAAQAEKAPKDGVKGGMKLSVNDFVVKAASVALKDVPEANSSWMGDFVRQ